LSTYRTDTLDRYVQDLAARLPAPGGGSAAALAASLGAALGSMVINFTIGKPRYARYETQLNEMLGRSEKLKNRFLDLVDLDVAAFSSGKPQDALDVPFMVCRLCLEAIRLCPPLLRKGNVNLISDVAVAASLLEAGFVSARFNVQINLKGFADKRAARSIRAELRRAEKSVRKIRERTEAEVGKIIGG